MQDHQDEAKRFLEATHRTLTVLIESCGNSDVIRASMEQYNHFFCAIENILTHGLQGEQLYRSTESAII
jgi:hypothetical protein